MTALRYGIVGCGSMGRGHIENLKALGEIGLEEGLRAVAPGLAAHKRIDEGRVVALAEVLPAGW